MSAAVLQMGNDKTTVLHEDGVAPQTRNKGPLALMLDYGDNDDDDDDDGDDDGEDREGGERGAHENGHCISDKTDASEVTIASESNQPPATEHDPLASFLDDLSNQGLLDDQQDGAGTSQGTPFRFVACTTRA